MVFKKFNLEVRYLNAEEINFQPKSNDLLLIINQSKLKYQAAIYLAKNHIET